MPDSRYFKSRYILITIKPFKVKHGSEATSTLRNNKYTGIETSTSRRWLYCSLSKWLIHFLLNNGMMSYSCLHTELPEIMEQGRTSPKLKMVTLNTNLLEVMLLSTDPKNGKAYQPEKLKMRMMRRLWTVT